MSTQKIYTEEQVRQVIAYYNTEKFVTTDELLEDLRLTPIELPSDEEIKKEIKFDWLDPEDVAYLGGAIWMRNKIGGNNEQQ